jgi:hypothetical protein
MTFKFVSGGACPRGQCIYEIIAAMNTLVGSGKSRGADEFHSTRFMEIVLFCNGIDVAEFGGLYR